MPTSYDVGYKYVTVFDGCSFLPDYRYRNLGRILLRVVNGIVSNSTRRFVVISAAGVHVAVEAGEIAA